jgi:hypothetical protein
MSFQSGDLVKCVDGDAYRGGAVVVFAGETYEVSAVYPGARIIHLAHSGGFGWSTDRFVLDTDAMKQRQENLRKLAAQNDTNMMSYPGGSFYALAGGAQGASPQTQQAMPSKASVQAALHSLSPVDFAPPVGAMPEPDSVNQPNHYARYTIEPATFIAANKLPFDVGSIVKYVCRYDAKNGREDVLKARRFCDMLLERIDREARVVSGESKEVVWATML